MGEHDFNDMQAAILRKFANEEARRNPIFYKGEFREDEWFSLLNSGELISKNTLRNQKGIDGYLCITDQIDRLGWATREQIENCRWAITPEGLERVRKEIKQDKWVPYTVIVFAPCFQTDDDWKKLRLDAHLLDMCDLHIRYNYKFARYVYSVLSMKNARIQDPHERWAVAEEWVKKEYAKYLEEEYAKAEHEYEERIKRDDLDDFVDSIAAEHREPCKTKKLPDWYEDLAKCRTCIVFNEPFEYGKFRAEFSDVLLLPSAHDVYAMHPEIAENKWPVVIRAERYGVVKMTWSIAQSDYRKRRTISGLDWFEYDELEDYEQAKNCNNEHCWFVAREMRGKDK